MGQAVVTYACPSVIVGKLPMWPIEHALMIVYEAFYFDTQFAGA
jgi:hypothetical protein